MKTGYDVANGESIVYLNDFEANILHLAICRLRGNEYLSYEQECLLNKLDDFLNRFNDGV